MVDIHELWEAKIKHVLKSPNWDYECNNVATTAHTFNKIPNLEYELLSAINEQKTKEQLELQGFNELQGESGELDSLTLPTTEEFSPCQRCEDECKCRDIEAGLDELGGSKKKVRKKSRRESCGKTESEGSSTGYTHGEWVEDDWLPEMFGSPHISDTSDGEEDDLILEDVAPVAEIYDPALFRGYSNAEEAKKEEHEQNVTREDSLEETNKIPEMLSHHLHEEQVELLTPITALETPRDLPLFSDSQDWSNQLLYQGEEEDVLTPMTPVVDKLQKLALGNRDGYCFTFVSDGDEDDDDVFTRSHSDVESSLLPTYSGNVESPLFTTKPSSTKFYEQDSLEVQRSSDKEED